jgi:hypothetical protein
MLSFFKSGSSPMQEALLDTSSDPGSTNDAMRNDMQAPGMPTWMQDDEASACFACDVEFTLTYRRHHCRRCRSIFCERCTVQRSKILVLAITENARVCDECFAELPFENNFIEWKKPMLQRGATFQKSRLCCLGNVPVTLRLDADGQMLLFSEDKGDSAFRLEAADIESLTPSGDESFLLVHPDMSVNLICNSEETKQQWMAALIDLVKVCREPSLHDKVARIRWAKVESKRRAEEIDRRNSELIEQMAARRRRRDEILSRSIDNTKPS